MAPENLTIGATLMGTVAPDEFVASVKAVERWGYDHLWVTDSSLHARSVYPYLTLAALNSERLQLGTNCTHPLVHPSVSINALATINELSGGRGILGIGAGGGPTAELGFTRGAKVSEVEAMATAARRMYAGARIDVEAPRFQIADGALMHGLNGAPRPRVYITASGPRMLELAGRVADGVLMCCGAFPEGLEFALSHVRRGAEAAGRDITEIDVAWHVFGTFNHDAELARRHGAQAGAMFANAYGVYCEMAGIPDELVRRIREAYRGARHFTEAERAHALVSDEIVERVTISGDAGTWRERLELAERFGIDHLEVFPLGDRPAVLEGLAAEVFRPRVGS
jgi:5,10-methylenetetrahydromethanopterin reductase